MYNNKHLSFNEEELISIYKIVKEYLEDLPENMDDWYHSHYDFDEEPIEKELLLSIIKRLKKNLPYKEIEEFDKNFLRKKYHPYNNEIDEQVYEIIEKAFNDLKTIEIEYFNMERAELKKRNIDVYYKSRKYIIGYCHLKKSIRKFRTSRIKSVKLTNTRYKIPEDFDGVDY